MPSCLMSSIELTALVFRPCCDCLVRSSPASPGGWRKPRYYEGLSAGWKRVEEDMPDSPLNCRRHSSGRKWEAQHCGGSLLRECIQTWIKPPFFLFTWNTDRNPNEIRYQRYCIWMYRMCLCTPMKFLSHCKFKSAASIWHRWNVNRRWTKVSLHIHEIFTWQQEVYA